MKNLLSWVKKNWQFLVIVILVVFLFKGRSLALTNFSSSNYGGLKTAQVDMVAPAATVGRGGLYQESAPVMEAEERLVVRNSYLSLLVESVREVQTEVIAKAEGLGGYMVDSRIDSPLGIDSATVTIRIPEPKLNEALEYFRGLGIRVVSENLTGRDVTDEYVDLEARLATLQKTKAKFEEILESATKVADILEVQRQIISIQEQIDSLKGRTDYLKKTAESAKVTVYLSTDELSLPYAPTQPWRPKVIFKTATRSLIKATRGLGSLVIWVGVYAIVWLPILLIIWVVKKRVKKKA